MNGSSLRGFAVGLATSAAIALAASGLAAQDRDAMHAYGAKQVEDRPAPAGAADRMLLIRAPANCGITISWADSGASDSMQQKVLPGGGAVVALPTGRSVVWDGPATVQAINDRTELRQMLGIGGPAGTAANLRSN